VNSKKAELDYIHSNFGSTEREKKKSSAWRDHSIISRACLIHSLIYRQKPLCAGLQFLHVPFNMRAAVSMTFYTLFFCLSNHSTCQSNCNMIMFLTNRAAPLLHDIQITCTLLFKGLESIKCILLIKSDSKNI